MLGKEKSSTSKKAFLQGALGGQLLGTARVFFLLFGVMGMLAFWSSTRPIPEAIATLRNFEMPDSVENAHHYLAHNSQPAISRFTIDVADVNQLLDSFEDDSLESCLVEYLEKSYMPDFTPSTEFDWWNPQDAIEYEGADCWRNYNSGRTRYVLLLIDYSVIGEASFYFEQYYIVDGERVGFK